MKVLLTGSAGFVGTAFQQWFASNRPDDELVLVDILDPACPREARTFFRHSIGGYDLAIHLAAVVGGRMTIEGDQMAVAADLAIDADLFQWCLRTKPRHVVYFSSSAAYPVYLQTEGGYALRESDINLDDVASPDLTYGWAKLTGEIQARLVTQAGIPVLVPRPFSGYGPSQSPDYPTPAIVARAVRRDTPLEIWSDATRDFVHIDDVVAATMAMVDQRVYGTVNICTGVGTTFTQLAETAMLATGYLGPVEIAQGKPAGVAYRVGDPREMLQYYKPKIGVAEGIAQMVQALS